MADDHPWIRHGRCPLWLWRRRERGDPCWFAYAAQTIRLLPIPQAVRTVTMAAHHRLAALVNDTDTNTNA